MPQAKEKPDLTDLEKADCLTGKMIGGIALKAPGWGSGKRRRFVFLDRNCCYHVMSRVAGGDLLFGDVVINMPGIARQKILCIPLSSMILRRGGAE